MQFCGDGGGGGGEQRSICLRGAGLCSSPARSLCASRPPTHPPSAWFCMTFSVINVPGFSVPALWAS